MSTNNGFFFNKQTERVDKTTRKGDSELSHVVLLQPRYGIMFHNRQKGK